MAMATTLRSAGRRLLAGQQPQQGIHRAAAEGQRRLLPTAIHGGGSAGYSRQYGTFERCMRVGDLFVRATTAVSIISVSSAILVLSVALPIKVFSAPKKPRETRQEQPSSSRCLCHQPNVEEKMQELREVLAEYDAQRRAQG